MFGVRFLDADFLRINLTCASPTVYVTLHSRKGKSGRMHRDCNQDGGTGAGAQHGDAGREANLIFVLPPNVYVGPPVGGTFWVRIFIQAPSLEIWRKTIFGGEGGSGEEVGWPVLGYLLGKNIGGRSRSYHSAQEDGCSSLPCRGVLSFRSGAREASGNEAPQVHHAARRCGNLAAHGARTTAEGADHRRTGHWQYQSGAVLAGVSAGTARSGVCRGADHSI